MNTKIQRITIYKIKRLIKKKEKKEENLKPTFILLNYLIE